MSRVAPLHSAGADATPGALSRWLAREKGRRPWPFLLHSLCGLQLSLFFGFVCLTGTVATLSYEIEWLLLPKVRASALAAPAAWGALWDAARAAHPQVAFESIARAGSGHADYLARAVRGSRLQATHFGATDEYDEAQQAQGFRNTDSVTLVDLSSSVALGPGRLALGVSNLFNRRYVNVTNQASGDFFYYLSEGRRASLTYQLRY